MTDTRQNQPRPLTVKAPSAPLSGRIRVPGDKSISHRALMFAALAEGETAIDGLLEGEDVLRTAAAMRALGAEIERKADGRWLVRGRGLGRLLEPEDVLDMGNSGTAARLLAGILASHGVHSVMTGDASLRRRPMARVIGPLSGTGAVFASRAGGRLPLSISGQADPHALHVRMEVASAQVKSAVLLAGLNAEGETVVEEPVPTRDHSENMLRHFGAVVSVEQAGTGRVIRLQGRPTMMARDVAVPSDPSSAAFPLVAALLVPGSAITIEAVGLNPSRTGLFDTLIEMGAALSIANRRVEGGEPVGDLIVRASALTGVTVPPERAPSMIDEYPVLAVAAAFAEGETRMRGLGELRVKESDRLAATVALLEANGVVVRVEEDDLIVSGVGGGGAERLGGGTILTLMDHRLAMSGVVFGLAAGKPVHIDDVSFIDTSFPGFHALMDSVGAGLSAGAGVTVDVRLIVAVDGPAAAGKGTLARALADALELPYLDTGLLYRAVGRRMLDSGLDPASDAEAAARSLLSSDLQRTDLRTPDADRAASAVASQPKVRSALLAFQRAFGAAHGAVLDGRDIGTVIFPQAPVKLFVTASTRARAERRWAQMRGDAAAIDPVLRASEIALVEAELRARDAADSARAAAPLRAAADAIEIDTDGLDAAEVLQEALRIVRARLETLR